MADPRIEKLAEVLVHHSTRLQEGDYVLIRAGGPEAIPLVREVYRLAIRAGAHPFVQVSVPGLAKIAMDESSEEQLRDITWGKLIYEQINALISIGCTSNAKEMSNVDPAKMRIAREASRPLQKYVMEDRFRWVGTQFPCNALAQEAEVSLEEYEAFVYGATNIDYAALEKEMTGICEHFNAASEVRIVANETDVTVDIAGRKGIVCAGERNVPDGEFFFTPNHLETRGHITYDWPVVLAGREVRGIRLEFVDGRVEKFSAEKGEDYLAQALDTDEGARFLGELGIGMNFGIQKPTKNILFDEKIGGSVHLALGAGYPEGGKGNESALHWDMVKNLRDGGKIYLDGKLVQENGEWLIQ